MFSYESRDGLGHSCWAACQAVSKRQGEGLGPGMDGHGPTPMGSPMTKHWLLLCRASQAPMGSLLLLPHPCSQALNTSSTGNHGCDRMQFSSFHGRSSEEQTGPGKGGSMAWQLSFSPSLGFLLSSGGGLGCQDTFSLTMGKPITLLLLSEPRLTSAFTIGSAINSIHH